MEILLSKKGTDMVAFRGYIYRQDKAKINTVHWRCSKTGCKGRLATRLNYKMQVESEDEPIETDLKYTEQHEWVRVDGSVGTVGITAKAADSMGDLVYVEIAEPGQEIDQGDECGSVESVKAVSDIYAPVSGTMLEKNPVLAETPDVVNKDPYGEEGWLFKLELSKPEELEDLMTEEQYNAFIAEE